jgi:imidazolonepropionase-like amidohydrolase
MSSLGFDTIGRRARASMHWMLGLTAVMTTGVLISSGQTVSPALRAPSAAVVESRDTIAFRDVNVITMTGREPPLIRTTVVVSQGEITSVGADIPPGARVIEGNGKWLIPGLIDMHVHLPADSHFRTRLPTDGANFFFSTQDVMTPFVANGVTTVLECNSRADHFSQRNEIARGLAFGPRMGLAALINGGDGDGRRANTASDGRQAVRDAKAEGYDFIKVYSDLDVEVLRAIVDEAAKRGMKVVGHIPSKCKGQTSECLKPQFGLVAHAEELAKQADTFSDEEADRLVGLMRASNAWISPTLVTIVDILDQSRSLDELKRSRTLKYVHPLLQSKWLTSNNYARRSNPETIAYLERLVAFDAKLVRKLNDAGVPILVGTDTGTSGVIAGFSLHDEMELLVAAGMTPGDVLKSATFRSAKWLGLDAQVGSIEVGKRADLVLLDANPLDDIQNSRQIAGVVIDGHWLDRNRLDAMLVDLAARNDRETKRYDWATVTGFSPSEKPRLDSKH